MFDIVVPFNHRAHFWDRVARGIAENGELVDTVLVANTGGYSPDLHGVGARHLGRPASVIDAPKHRESDFNVSAAVNRAVEYVKTKHFILTGDDIVLPPGMLSTLMEGIGPQEMHVGEVVEQPESMTWGELSTIDLSKRPIRRKEGPPHFLLAGSPVAYDTAAFRALGGWNEDMRAYGLQDHEFTLRWLRAYGYGSVKVRPAVAFHLGAMSSQARLRGHPSRFVNENYLTKALQELERTRGPYKVKVTT